MTGVRKLNVLQRPYEEAVFGSLQKKEWLQSPRPQDPWDSRGSDLFQMPIPQRTGSFTLLLWPFPTETVKLLHLCKKACKIWGSQWCSSSHCCTEQGQSLAQLVLSNWKELASDLSYLLCTAGIIFPEAGKNLKLLPFRASPTKMSTLSRGKGYTLSL